MVMDMKIAITIPGEPEAKMRPVFARRGKFISTYTPDITVRYENLVKMMFINAREDAGVAGLLEGPLEIRIDAYFPIPSSESKKRKAMMLSGEIKCTKKKDVDNIAKIVMDGLSNVAYKDDKQIVELVVTKQYSEEPRVEVVLKEVE
jgi:Holliday junction resolvase RusA-like endonuclease